MGFGIRVWELTGCTGWVGWDVLMGTLASCGRVYQSMFSWFSPSSESLPSLGVGSSPVEGEGSIDAVFAPIVVCSRRGGRGGLMG